MLYLLGAVACGTVFAQSYKFAVAREYDVDWVSVCSFVSSALLLLLTQVLGLGVVTWQAILLGIGYGLAGGVSQLAYFRAVRLGAFSVSWTVIQMSVLLPVLASILFWAELPTLWQGAAIGGALIAIALMGDVEVRQVSQPEAWVGWLGFSFITSGLAGILLRAAGSLTPDRSETTFLLVSYAASALLAGFVVRGRRLGRQEVAVGVVRGIAILLANYLVLQALNVLPGFVVFAAYGSAGVVINVLAAILCWGERPRGRVLVGIVLAVATIIVLNL